MPEVYRDDHLVAVHKPAGLIVHANDHAPLRDTCLRRVRSQTGRLVYPCHRLDRATSGLLLFTFSPETLAIVSRAFQQRQVEKRYVVMCRGYLAEDKHLIEDEIDGQWALTRFQASAYYRVGCAVGRYPTARYALLEAAPVSGRRHQIRRHLKRLGHPVLLDRKHGDRDHNRFLEQYFGLRTMFLAATELRLQHPVSGQSLDLRAPLASPLQALLEQLEDYKL